jgi:hypothetical protein
VGVAVSCPRCGGPVRSPDLMHPDWRCDGCGPVPPLHVAQHNSAEIMRSAIGHIVAGTPPERAGLPLWTIWPLLPGWMVTGVAWAGDDRTGVRAVASACSGPVPLGEGPADIVLVAEEPGAGLGTRFAGIPGPDPGPQLAEAVEATGAHAKIKVDGHPTPLWSIKSPDDRSAYVGEARGVWLYAIAWPASAGYVFAEHVVLHDLCEWLPPELVYGAPSPYLHGKA